MQELTLNEVQDVNGGVLPIVIGIVATDAFAIGFTAGFITGYATMSNLFKAR
ncbi:MAG: class IIb bacteriocin, lactobin A/cerein 7B family [Aestuariibacter sp.]